jgi:pimeloyl-ACP methyl ester carboxylesterase
MRRPFLPTAAPPAPWAWRRGLGDGYGQTAEPDWREVDWPAHLNRATIDGAELNYVDIGSGHERPLVFVHGLGGQWQNWLENVPRAAQDRRVIVPDLPGFGLSPMPNWEITISAYGRVVEGLCEHLGLGRVDMVGNSMGGFIASEVAIQFPERIDRLVLVSAAGISSAGVAQAPVLLIGRIAAAITTHSVADQRRISARPGARHAAMALVCRNAGALKGDLVYEGFVKGAGKPGFVDALKANLTYDFRERLPEISRPTLIVWGENDSILPVRDAHEFERLIDDSRKVVMRETGHVPMAERPQAFNDLLLDFLAETGPAEERERVEGESQAA